MKKNEPVVSKRNFCIICNELVVETDDKFMLAFEKPYINLYIHKACWHNIKSDLVNNLLERKELILELAKNP